MEKKTQKYKPSLNKKCHNKRLMINISPNCYAKFIDQAWSDECTKSVEDLKELKIIQMNQVFLQA